MGGHEDRRIQEPHFLASAAAGALETHGAPNPYPIFKEHRDRHPVYEGDLFRDCFSVHTPAFHEDGRQVYTVLGYNEARRVLTDASTFATARYEDTAAESLGRDVLLLSGAEHRAKRLLLQRALTREIVEKWHWYVIQPLVHKRYLDRFVARKRTDLMRQFAAPFPVSVLHAILDLPSEQTAQFHEAAVQILAASRDPATRALASAALAEQVQSVLEERRSHPGTDLISLLLRVEEAGTRLSDEEIVAFVLLSLPANAPASRTIGSLLVALLSHPEQLAAVRKDRSLIAQAVEEGFRWEAPSMVSARLATRATEIAGVRIPRGAAVNVALGAANRDERRFPDGERFDITRRASQHLGFALGVHACLGRNLARTECAVGIGAVVERLVNLRLDPTKPAPEITGIMFRSPEAIHVVWD